METKFIDDPWGVPSFIHPLCIHIVNIFYFLESYLENKWRIKKGVFKGTLLHNIANLNFSFCCLKQTYFIRKQASHTTTFQFTLLIVHFLLNCFTVYFQYLLLLLETWNQSWIYNSSALLKVKSTKYILMQNFWSFHHSYFLKHFSVSASKYTSYLQNSHQQIIYKYFGCSSWNLFNG